MTSFGPHARTVVLVLLLPLSIAISTETQNVQMVLLAVSLLYLSLAGWFLRAVSRDDETPTVASKDFLLRRGGAWVLVLFTLFVSLLITQQLVVGSITVLILYLGGVLDHASLRLDERRRNEAPGTP